MFQYLNGLNSEIQDKQAEAYLYAPSGTVGIAATGVIEGLVVRQTSTASGSVLIDAGACLNQASLGQGADRLIAPAQETLDIFTTNPVGGLPRNDIIVADSLTTSILAIIGTPNATPTDPTVPATSVALARLRHAASALTIPTAKIDTLIVPTTLRQPAAAAPSPWVAYTPAWTASGTAPALGNGTLVGASNASGNQIAFRATLTLGSTSTIGTGAYSISLPFAAVAVTGLRQYADVWQFDASVGSMFKGEGLITSGGSVVDLYVVTVGTNGQVAVNAGTGPPVIPAAGDTITVSGVYERA